MSRKKVAKDWRKNIDTTKEEVLLSLLSTQKQHQGHDNLFCEDRRPITPILSRTGESKSRLLYIDRILQPDSSLPAISTKSFTPPAKLKDTTASSDYRTKSKHEAKKLKALVSRQKASTRTLTVETTEKPVETLLWDPLMDEKKIQKAKVMKNPGTCIPLIDTIHPGSSYMPSLDSYKEALDIACEMEIKRSRKDKIRHQTAPAQSEEADIPNSTDLQSQNTATEDVKNEAEIPQKPAKRKTKSQRQRIIKEKFELEQRKQDKARKRLADEMALLVSKNYQKRLLKDLAAKRKLSAEKKLASHEKRLKMTKKLSPYEFEEPMFPIPLPNEQTSCLRRISSVVHPVMDRFKNLQKRNIIEVRMPVRHKRKYKLRTIERSSYKNFK